MTKFPRSSTLWLSIILKASVYFWSISKGSSTDIEEWSPIIDRSLGYDVSLPVLACHSKNTGYRKVTWYKDGVVVQNGSADLSGHMLSVGSLLAKPFPDVFNSPLKLQGYYWCDIDLNFKTKSPQKYLFQIPNVHTYVGSMVVRIDHLGNTTHASLEKNELEIMKGYENDLQNVLFSFLLSPKTFVTHINQTQLGFGINFFLYDEMVLNPRVTSGDRLDDDESQLNYIKSYINNRTAADEDYLTRVQEWKQRRGISFIDIKISSTTECYREVSVSSGNKLLTWPYTPVGAIAVTDEGCLTEDNLAVIRVCMGSFTTGAEWGPVQGVCSAYPHNRSVELKALLKSPGPQEETGDIQKLQKLTDNPKDLTVVDLHLVTSIIEEISHIPRLSTESLDAVFTTIDNIFHSKISTLDAAKGTLRLSSRLMEAIDQLTSFDYSKELTITKSELLVAAKGTTTADDLIVGVSVLPREQWLSSPNDSVRFVGNGTDVTALQSVAGFVLPSDLIIKRETHLSYPCQLNMVYFTDWRLFTNPRAAMRHRNYEAAPAPVIHVGISGGPAWNLSNPIRYYFKNDFESDLHEEPFCSYFDPKLHDGHGGWATEGCNTESLQNDYYVCHCHHIAMLSIIVPRRPGYLLLFRPSISIFIGCGLSIAILCFLILFYISSKTWRSCVNHHVLFYLALSLLCSLVLLLVHNVQSRWGPGCMFLTIVFHYFVQVIFCWLLVHSLVHHSMFCRNTKVDDMGKFLTRANVFAWDFPFFVVGITWVVKGSEYYNHKICWATMTDISEIIFYPVVLLLLLTLCFNTITAFCVMCGEFKDLEMRSKDHTEAILKFKVSLSIFVLFFLCWLFGYLSLHGKPKEFQILFGISVTVTSLYIFLFFVFHDISPRDIYFKVCSKTIKVGDSTDAIASHEVKTYNATK